MTDDQQPTVDPQAREVALRWVQGALQRQDLASVWQVTDADTRLALTQHALIAIGAELDPETRDALAQALADGSHPDFPHLMRRLTRELAQATPMSPDDVLYTGTYARLLAPDIEGVVFAQERDIPDGVFRPGPMVALTIPVRIGSDGQRRVAGCGWLVTPGWPPEFAAVDGSIG